MKRFSIMFVLTALILGLLPILAQEPVTITMSTWAGVEEAAELQEILDEINASQTEYQIVHEPIPTDYYTQVQTQLAGGVGADLYWIDQDNMSLAAEGVFLPIDECVADAEPETAGDLADYYPGILQIAQFDGQTYGLPWIAAPVVTFYNRDLFEAAGLEEPTADWTWDDFMEAARALTQDIDGDGTTDQWGFAANGWPPPHIFIWQAGGDVLAEDLSESAIDSPEALAGINFYLDLVYNPEISASRDVIAEQGFGELFKAGKVGMFMGGAADDLDRVEGLDVGVVPVPRNPETGDNTTFAWSATTTINANTENPELACAALLAVTEGIQNWKIVSPRISQSTVEHLVASEPRKEASAAAIIEAVPSMRAFRIFGNFQEWNQIFWDEFMNPLINDETDLSPEELAAEIRPELEDTLP
jgi:multiple sugar transport system substrate-binding protein